MEKELDVNVNVNEGNPNVVSSLETDPIYKHKDGRIFTKNQLLSEGYNDERIKTGLDKSLITLIGDTRDADQQFKHEDGRIFTNKQLIDAGYTQERIDNGISIGKISPIEKKNQAASTTLPKEPSVGVSDGTISTPKPKQVFDWEKDLLNDKYFNKPNRTDATYLAKPLTGEKIEQAERGRANMKLAVENTTERALKAKGIKTPKNSPTYLKQKKKIEDAVKNEDAAYAIDPITKQPALSQTTGFFESMWNGFKSAINDESESDDFVNKMTTKERVDYANKKLSEIEITEDGFIGKKPSTIGRVGEIVGGVAPFAAKATAGAMAGAGLVAVAPETAGASLAGLPTVMSFAFTTPDMINQGAKNEVLRRYSILKQQNPNSPDEFIMRQAEKGLASGGITGAVTNLAFTGIGAKPLTQIGSKAISNEAKLTIGKYVGNILKSGAHLGTIVSGTEAAKEIEAGIEDKRLRLSPSQIAENATNNFVDNATVGVVLHTLTTLPQLPGAVKSTLKWSLKNENPADLTQILKTNEDIGNIPKGTVEKVMSDINGYNEALKKTSDDLTPEAQASVAGLIQKRDKLKAEMATKDETQVESYNEQIKSLDEQIKEITKTNNPFEFEVNEVGEKINGEIKPAPLQKGIEGGVELPKVEEKTKETAKALEEKLKSTEVATEDKNKIRDSFTDKMIEEYNRVVFDKGEKTAEQFISEAYYKDKASGKETELTKAVEDLLGKKVGEEVPQTELPVGEITDTEYSNFIDKGIVTPERLNDIAQKVKNKEKLSDREREIFTDKTADINKIIAGEEETPKAEAELPPTPEKVTPKVEEEITPMEVEEEQPPFVEGGREVVTRSGLTEQGRQKLIAQRNKELKITDRVKDEQAILDIIERYNSLKKGRLGQQAPIGLDLLNKIRNKVGEFNQKYNADYEFGRATLLNDKNRTVKRKTLKDRDAEIDESGKSLRDRDLKTQEIFDDLFQEGALPTGYTGDKMRMSEPQLNATIQDILDGVPSRRANNYLDALEKQIREDDFDFSKSDDMPAYMRPQIKLDDVLGVSREEATEPMTEDMLNDWLSKESEITPENQQVYDNIENLITYHETRNEPEGEVRPTPTPTKERVAEPTKPVTKEEKPSGKVAAEKPTAEKVEPKAEPPEAEIKEYNSKNLPNPIGKFEAVNVIPYTTTEKNKFAPNQQLKFNQGDKYEPVRIVGDSELIELIQIGARQINNITGKAKKFIDKNRQKQLEEKFGITAYDANMKAKQLAKENRGNVENIIIIGEKPIEKAAEKVEPKAEAPKEEKIAEKTPLQKASEARRAAKAKLDSLRKGLGINEQAKLEALVDYHRTLVAEAKEFIKEKAGDINEWAKSIGEKVNVVLQKAWDEAKGAKPVEKAEDLGYSIEEIAGGKEPEGLITKEELSKYEEAKKLFESEGKTTWNEVVGKATERLIKDNPNRTVEESAQNHANRLASLYDKGEAINPTAEDLAIINIAKLNVEKKISELEGWDSQDAAEREATMIEFDKLNADLLNIAKAANPREAGLAFNIRQMVLSMGNDGLKMRRMELMKQKGGEPLSESDLNFTREQWAKEKALIEKKSELEKQALQDRFDAEIKAEQEKYQKLLEQKEKLKGAKLEIKNRQEALKQKGKEFADKLRKGAIKGTYSDPFLIGQSLNFVINRVADIVESGFTLAAAIDKYVAENKIESRRQKVEDAIFDHLNRQDKREKAIELINQQIADTNSKTITKEMVDNNSIKDFVDSYVNTVDVNQVSDVAFKKLKEILPDLNKEDFKKAYLKEGNYKKVTSAQLKNEATNQQKIFNRLTSLQNKLGELKKTGDLLKEGSSKKEQINSEIKKLNDAIQKELVSIGKKLSSKSALAKEGYEKRASEHNKNIDEVSNEILEASKLYELSDSEKQYLDNMLGKLKDSKIEYDTQSKLDQSSNVEKATEKIDLLQKQLDKTKKSINKDLAYDIDLGLQKIKDRYESTKKEVDQSIMLEQAKQNAINKKKELERKLSSKEFDDTPSKKVLTKSDTELAKVNADLNLVKSAYDKKAEEYRKANRSAGQVILETLRSIGVNTLIGMPKTFAKLTFASPLKIAQTYLSKLTFGRISERVFNEGLIQSAKEGGESSSTLSANTGLKAVFKNANSKQLEVQSEKNANKYIKSATDYESALKNLEKTKSEYGETSPEYIKENKKVDKIKAKSDKNLLISVGDTLYQYIGGSTLKTALEKLKSRNTEYERSLGDFGSESWTKVKKWSDVADNVSYIFGYIGRSHGSLKSISARYHVATGFMARLEAALAKGEDITDFNKLQEMAADSYTDWESGMYQQENWVTTKGNKIVDDFRSSDRRAARIVGELLSWDVAITKVPVNIINEAVVEMALGLPLSIGKYTKEYQKAKRVVSAEMPKLTSKEKEKYPSQAYSKEEYRKALAEEMSKIDKKTAATIVRMFRHGGFGLGMLGLALAINAQYGGAHHKGEKKEDEKKGEEELKTGEISVGNKKLNKYFAASLDHTSGVFPFLAYQNMLINYKKAMDKDKGEAVSITEATVKQLEHIIETYPQAKVVNPITIGKEAYRSYKGAVQRAGQEYLGIEPEKKQEVGKKRRKQGKEKKKKKSE